MVADGTFPGEGNSRGLSTPPRRFHPLDTEGEVVLPERRPSIGWVGRRTRRPVGSSVTADLLTDGFESGHWRPWSESAVRPVGSARVPYRDDVGMRMEVDARRNPPVLLRAVALRPRGSF